MTTDAVKQAISKHLDALRPVLDGDCRPSGVRVAVWLLPDGTIREVETQPVFTTKEAKR